MQKAADLCETLYLIMFIGGVDERNAVANLQDNDDTQYLSPVARSDRIAEIVKDYPNVKFVVLDVTDTINENGEEDWDMQTPMVLDACGHLDAVFGSEPSYADYFSRAYPDAEYVIIDTERKICPVSGTLVRNMTPEERAKWIA